MGITIKYTNRFVSSTVSSKPPGQPESRPCREPAAAPVDVCIHRGDLIGTANCGCRGAPTVYECNKLFRPNQRTADKAFCSNDPIGKPLVSIFHDGKRIHDNVLASEIVTCTASMCDLYQVKDSDNGTSEADSKSKD